MSPPNILSIPVRKVSTTDVRQHLNYERNRAHWILKYPDSQTQHKVGLVWLQGKVARRKVDTKSCKLRITDHSGSVSVLAEVEEIPLALTLANEAKDAKSEQYCGVLLEPRTEGEILLQPEDRWKNFECRRLVKIPDENQKFWKSECNKYKAWLEKTEKI